jgi:hypothetical protein
MVCPDSLTIVNTDVVSHVLSRPDGADNGLGMLTVHVEVQMVTAVEAAPAMEFVGHISSIF